MLLLIKKMYHACPTRRLCRVVHNFSRWSFLQYNLVECMSNKVVTLLRKLFCFIFSAVDRKSSHAYVEDGNVELQQFDKYGYYFYNLSTVCTSLVLVIGD